MIHPEYSNDSDWEFCRESGDALIVAKSPRLGVKRTNYYALFIDIYCKSLGHRNSLYLIFKSYDFFPAFGNMILVGTSDPYSALEFVSANRIPESDFTRATVASGPFGEHRKVMCMRLS